jgi:hypothetical protein
VGGKNPARYPPTLSDRMSLREWIENYPGWALSIRCTRCVHSGIIFPRKVRHRYIRRIGDLKARLYCPKCKSTHYWVAPVLIVRRD